MDPGITNTFIMKASPAFSPFEALLQTGASIASSFDKVYPMDIRDPGLCVSGS